MSSDRRARRLAAVDANETDVEVVDLTARCARPKCRAEFMPSGGRGRPRLYCSPACGDAADAEHKTAQATVRHYEKLLRDARADLATFGRGQEPEFDSDDELLEASRQTWSRADGAVAFANPGDPGLHAVLRDLVEATRWSFGPGLRRSR